MKDKIINTVKKLVIKNSKFNISENEITEDVRFVEDLKFDSLRYINFIVDLEETFKIQLTNAEELVSNTNTFGQIVQYISNHLEEV